MSANGLLAQRNQTIMDAIRRQLAENLARVEERIAAACQRAGRSRDSVTLVAVTKTVSVEIASELVLLGPRDLGENRPQELWRKRELIPDVRWHLIGHLQRNKIERTVPIVHRIHSVDSFRLLKALDQYGPAMVLLEFNCSDEPTKGGFSPLEVDQVIEALSGLRQLRVTGLMTMAALQADPERCRPTFQRLRLLRDRIHATYPLHELSMGMSNDFEVAIEEGATLVRLGSVLFEGLSR